jgi:peptidoglycan/xylan/chitin deacetylase (PgdA/CDA1 family)
MREPRNRPAAPAAPSAGVPHLVAHAAWPGATGLAGLAAAAGIGYALPSVTTARRARGLLLPALAGRGRPGHVALTFDDGPDPLSTPAFMTALDELGVRATFFMLGDMVVRSPGLAREVASAGHELAVHGWDHRSMLLRGPRSTRDTLARATDVIADAAGRPPRWLRPPFGVVSTPSLVAARRLGLRTVLWTAWARDWMDSSSAATIIGTLTPDLRGGATILLHDSDCTSAPGSWRATLSALPDLASRCATAGLALGPLADHGLHPARRPTPSLAAPT